jgi:UDP:flavonoid glycosyltransferase YjiC (YdhE family)
MTEKPIRILFATSNGTGLGHLNRAMAIARRLPDDIEPVLFTLSQAAPVVARAGFRVEYHPAYRRPASGSDWQWNLRLRRRLEALLEAEQPDLVIFDGVHPYRALTHVLSAGGAPPSIWCRRPMWLPGSSAAPLRRTGAFDAVLEPGELAASRDRGPTAARRDEVLAVDPIVYLDEDELLGRERAAAELGIDPGRTTALVNLGQGGATDAAVARVLARLRAEPELQVAALESSIGPGLSVPDGVIRLSATFPMSRYFRAFDLAVAAAGYNSFHELIAFAVPALFVPMPRNTDDQSARAAWAADAGAGRAVAGPEDDGIDMALASLLEADERARLGAACRAASPGNGAATAAGAVAAAARGERLTPAVRDRSWLNRWLRLSSHPVGPSLPIALALTARDLGRHPERRRPRALLSAFDIPAAELEARLAEGIAALGEPADRILVITDTLELATLRRLCVGFQRVPTAGELGLSPDTPAYREQVDGRVEAILAPWRGSWPLARIGALPAALRARSSGPIREPEATGVAV